MHTVAAAMSPIPGRARWLGAVFVAGAVGFQAAWLGLPAVFLSVALLVSWLLWSAGTWRVTPPLRTACVVAIVVFLGHATEEFLTAFPAQLPALFGRAPWSATRYLVFNGAWAVVFVAAALAVRPGRHVPVLIILFLAVAGGVGNGVVHLGLVLWRGGYFPGAWTAPFCLAAGLWLLRLLYASPAPERPQGA